MLKPTVFAGGTLSPATVKDGVIHYNIASEKAGACTIVIVAEASDPKLKPKRVYFTRHDGQKHEEWVAPYCLAGDGPVRADVHQPFIIGKVGEPQYAPNLIPLPDGRTRYEIEALYSDDTTRETMKISLNVGASNFELPPAPEPDPEEPTDPVDLPLLEKAQLFPSIHIPLTASEYVPGIPLDKANAFYAELEPLYQKYFRAAKEREMEQPAAGGESEHKH